MNTSKKLGSKLKGNKMNTIKITRNLRDIAKQFGVTRRYAKEIATEVAGLNVYYDGARRGWFLDATLAEARMFIEIFAEFLENMDD